MAISGTGAPCTRSVAKKNGFPIAKTPRIFRQAGAQGGGATLLHAAAEALG